MPASDSKTLPGWSQQDRYFDPRATLIVYVLSFSVILLTTEMFALLLITTVMAWGVIRLQATRAWQQASSLLWPTLLLFALIVGFSDGVQAATGAVLRLWALVTVSVLFFTTTPPEELGESLLDSGLSPHAVFLLEGTLRFVPTMVLLVREVREAQESRGIRLDGLYLLRNGAALLAPLLADVLRFADDLAEALETRGFGGAKRTSLVAYRFRRQDWVLIAGAFIAVGVFMGLSHHLPL